MKEVNEKVFYEGRNFVTVSRANLIAGWFWKKYIDGSGALMDEQGKIRMKYDLTTDEYAIDNENYEKIPSMHTFRIGKSFFTAAEELMCQKLQ